MMCRDLPSAQARLPGPDVGPEEYEGADRAHQLYDVYQLDHHGASTSAIAGWNDSNPGPGVRSVSGFWAASDDVGRVVVGDDVAPPGRFAAGSQALTRSLTRSAWGSFPSWR